MRPLFLAALALVAAWPVQGMADWTDWSVSPPSFELGNWTGSTGGIASAAGYWAYQPDRGYEPGLNGSLLITPRLTDELDNGWEIGAHAALLAYRDELSGDIYGNRFFEKAYLSLQTQMGRFDLGQQDGAAYALSIVGPKVDDTVALDAADVTFFRNPVTGKPLIDAFRLVTGEFATENYAKISYITPRLYGIELAGSFTPYEARDGLPFLGQGKIVPDRQINLLEAAANYDGDLGPFSIDAYSAFVIGHDAARTQGHNDLFDWGAGAALAYDLGEANLTFGGGFRHSNAYGFDINEAFRTGATWSWRLSATATTGPWIAGFEFIDGLADPEAGHPRLSETGYEPSLGYVVNSNLQLTLGWQRLRLNRDAIAGVESDTALNAVFLHADLHV
jgi:hypothetical protein